MFDHYFRRNKFVAICKICRRHCCNESATKLNEWQRLHYTWHNNAATPAGVFYER